MKTYPHGALLAQYYQNGQHPGQKPRPTVRPAIDLHNLGLPKNMQVQRIELFRTKRKWYEFWKPKYTHKYLALCKNSVYDVTEALRAGEKK